MRRFVFSLWLGLWGLASVVGQDLKKVERTIGKEPRYESKAPRYFLLVFGAEAKHRVWVVQDGNKLYVDRNGNGDLKEPGECVFAKEGIEYTDPAEGLYTFKLDELREGDLVHRDFTFYTRKIHYIESLPVVRDYLKAHPDGQVWRISMDVQMPGFRGVGLGGRVVQAVGYYDLQGVLRGGDSPATASVLHFRGPWQITLREGPRLVLEREKEIITVLGTPGVGPGSMVETGYEKLVPTNVHPQVTLEFALAKQIASPVAQHYELRERC